ncbi:hypothetical protein [Metabacillus fastidiosus]|uniref:hypothetical protein n=1 Tax=Metabacillus fastidiosus TaxID=1458 RepID=UPI003D2A6C88
MLGDIDKINVEGIWVNGEILPSKNMESFNDFFEGIIDEDNKFEEENFSEE